ncbi:hypothetical protein LCGC14_1290120 [marine sediment metagenome]|uniref:Uncharacterized protein n=1 Tax=marine sediment metagenome TaxID=412755 RepID=A0A0F9KST1_9ZZZZ
MTQGKEWETAIGEVSGNPENSDELLTQARSNTRRKQIIRLEEEEDAAHQAKMARLGKETKASEQPAPVPGEVNTGFKVTGGLDMGHINYQELMQQQIQDREVLRQEASEAAANQQQVSESLREKLHSSEMELIKTSFSAQMQMLNKTIEGTASRGNFMDEYNGMMEVAKALGMAHPQASRDMSTELDLKKMEFENTRELRRMSREDKRADREFQRQLNKDAEDREDRKSEREVQRVTAAAAVQAEREKRSMFAAPFETLGMAIAKGFMDSNGGVSADAGEEPKRKQKRSNKRLEVDVGESGVTDCPECGEPVAIAPTARSAVCSSCDAVFPIDRIPAGDKSGIHGLG